jgi:hypothetical protein
VLKSWDRDSVRAKPSLDILTPIDIMIGRTSLQDRVAQVRASTAAATDPTERVTKLDGLHERGVLTDQALAARRRRFSAGTRHARMSKPNQSHPFNKGAFTWFSLRTAGGSGWPDWQRR